MLIRCATGIEDPRLTADEMDIQRQENIAYEYLCHLEEAKVYAESVVLQSIGRWGVPTWKPRKVLEFGD